MFLDNPYNNVVCSRAETMHLEKSVVLRRHDGSE
ncbi:Hypothetical protein Cp1002B_0434 [Corynebacterium pseudotuberculosis]|nr:Hypothetical protein CpPAT10_0417a [Corynebacterium pseudotuberculosis PAT10]AFF21569.1 Hypothetical protein CpP54B96_0417 [Corynebacterium pseudotuberculosis P54B96]AFH51336.1 Hypothetical protein Cp267_0429 [Corynebacterium pseudotuberculosis 267]AJC13150.1 hypothetical protein CpVD57_0421 [Corynebacterium pseudotuberculosis]AKJ55083.1 Hypothetical protein Cp12C_0439 [Corynebacterium pseudotuberculosis]